MEIDFPQEVDAALSFIEERDRAAYIRNAVKMQLARDGRLSINAGRALTSQGATQAINPAIAVLQRIAAARKVSFDEVLDEFNKAKSENLELESVDIANQMYLKALGNS